jgi:hypothetical protein
MDKQKAVRKILSKFNEPRGVLKRTEDGAEIVTEALPAGKKLVGGSDKEALQAYGSLYGTPEQQADIVNDITKSGVERQNKQMLDEIRAKKGTVDADSTEPGLKKSGVVESADKVDNLFRNKLLNTVASKLGRKTETDDSEANAQDVVELAAEKLGIPADSTLGNAAKAAAVTAIEMAPLNPSDFAGGKVLKAAGKLGRAKALKSALEKLKQARIDKAPVGIQTGVDKRSFKDLQAAIKKLKGE